MEATFFGGSGDVQTEGSLGGFCFLGCAYEEKLPVAQISQIDKMGNTPKFDWVDMKIPMYIMRTCPFAPCLGEGLLT